MLRLLYYVVILWCVLMVAVHMERAQDMLVGRSASIAMTRSETPGPLFIVFANDGYGVSFGSSVYVGDRVPEVNRSMLQVPMDEAAEEIVDMSRFSSVTVIGEGIHCYDAIKFADTHSLRVMLHSPFVSMEDYMEDMFGSLYSFVPGTPGRGRYDISHRITSVPVFAHEVREAVKRTGCAVTVGGVDARDQWLRQHI